MPGPTRRAPPTRPGARPAPERSAPPREGDRRVLDPAAALVPAGPRVREITSPTFVDTTTGTFRALRAPEPPPMTRAQFESELARLVRAHAADEENPGSLHCEGCRGAVSCTFCTDCEGCYRCTHSRGCRASTHLTHCADCAGCHDCAYCVACESCTRSSYLVLCSSCTECSYCFGCVGLAKRDFHVLNVKHTRAEYFRIVRALEEQLGLAR